MTKDKYLKLIQPAIDLCTKKSEDYQGGTVTLHSYFPFGPKSYVQMMFVKIMRLVSLAEPGKLQNFESVSDSVLDLINYAVFYLEYLNALEENKCQTGSPKTTSNQDTSSFYEEQYNAVRNDPRVQALSGQSLGPHLPSPTWQKDDSHS